MKHCWFVSQSCGWEISTGEISYCFSGKRWEVSTCIQVQDIWCRSWDCSVWNCVWEWLVQSKWRIMYGKYKTDVCVRGKVNSYVSHQEPIFSVVKCQTLAWFDHKTHHDILYKVLQGSPSDNIWGCMKKRKIERPGMIKQNGGQDVVFSHLWLLLRTESGY